MKYYRTFASKMNAYLLIACSVLYLIAIVLISVVAIDLVRKETVSKTEKSLDLALRDIEVILTTVEVSVDNISWVVKEHLDDPDYMFYATNQLVRSNPYIMGSTVAFIPDYFPSKGRYFAPYSCLMPGQTNLLSFQMGGEDYDYFNMEWFSVPVNKQVAHWSEPYFDEGGGDQTMTTYSLPIEDESGKIVAVITSDVSLSVLEQRISVAGLADESYNFLLSDSGKFLCHPDSSYVMAKTIFEVAEETHTPETAEVGQKMINGESGTKFFTLEGQRFFLVFAPLKNGWSAALIGSNFKLFSSIMRVIFVALMLLVIGLMAISLVVRRIVRRLTQPVTEFSYVAKAIAKGNFHARIPSAESTDELVQLKHSFIYLEQSINDYISELRSATTSKERMESELGIARQIQLSMIPKSFPEKDNFDIKATMTAAKEVGGDLYDYILKDGRLAFVVGDVSGKGVPAAMYMAIAKSTFHYLAKSTNDVSKILSIINDVISEDNDSNMFITMFVGSIDLNTMEMSYCNAGHNPIVVIPPEGKASLLHAKPNLAIGLFENFPYQSETLQLTHGTRLAIYTDGVTEAEDRAMDQYGEDRLLEYCSTLPIVCNSEQFISGLLASVHDFTSGNEQNDDITIMSIKV